MGARRSEERAFPSTAATALGLCPPSELLAQIQRTTDSGTTEHSCLASSSGATQRSGKQQAEADDEVSARRWIRGILEEQRDFWVEVGKRMESREKPMKEILDSLGREWTTTQQRQSTATKSSRRL